MYQVLRRSRITLNSHIDMAGNEAGNMRLFEATGAGTFLLTDFKDNLDTLFAPDCEVAAWRSIDDCLAGISSTANAGQRRHPQTRRYSPGARCSNRHLPAGDVTSGSQDSLLTQREVDPMQCRRELQQSAHLCH